VEEQRSERVVSQLVHLPPPTPQLGKNVMQLPLAQQPFGQELAVQIQTPPTHCFPDGHGAFVGPH
jgi:hypothetical protein